MLLNTTKRTFRTAALACVALSAIALSNGAVAQQLTSTAVAVCDDHDGDGWGWDGKASCRVENFMAVAGDCVDSDGDGWGWDGVASCRPGAVMPEVTPMPPAATSSNLVQTAIAANNFTVLATALQLTGLDSVLSDENAEFTVFAPNDQAFEALGSETLNALVADPDTLRGILLNHVLPGRVDATTALSVVGSTVETAGDAKLGLSINDGALYVNTSKVIATDINASNGIIHVLDRVILPRPLTQAHGTVVDVAVANGNFTTLVAALQAVGLDAVLADPKGEFTVFAPTDDAFAALGSETISALLADPDTLSKILLTHVISGAAVDSTTALALTGGSVETASGVSVDLSIRGHELFVNNSKVIIADIVTDNGIIHVIDTVIQ